MILDTLEDRVVLVCKDEDDEDDEDEDEDDEEEEEEDLGGFLVGVGVLDADSVREGVAKVETGVEENPNESSEASLGRRVAVWT